MLEVMTVKYTYNIRMAIGYYCCGVLMHMWLIVAVDQTHNSPYFIYLFISQEDKNKY